jgi:hypothetical protein
MAKVAVGGAVGAAVAAGELALVGVRHLTTTPSAVEGFLEKLGVGHEWWVEPTFVLGWVISKMRLFLQSL